MFRINNMNVPKYEKHKTRVFTPVILTHTSSFVTDELEGIRRLVLAYLNKHDGLDGIRQFMIEHPQVSRDLLKLYKDTHLLETGNRKRVLIGSHTDDEWDNKKVEYNHKCVYCNKESEKLTKDHIIPVSHGGSNTIDNIVPACRSCNSKKHTRLLGELGDILPDKIL